MITSLFNLIQQFLIPYGAWGVFLASVIEEIIAPIPSALVMTAAGFFLIPNHAWTFDALKTLVFTIAIPGALGVTLGSLIIYGLGYISGKPALIRWGGYFGLTWTDVENMEKNFSRGYSDELMLFLVRAIPIIPSVVISGFCGIIRLPLKEYVMYSFLGTIVRNIILAAIGWRVGAVYESIAVYIDKAENVIFILSGALMLGFIGYRIYKRYIQK